MKAIRPGCLTGAGFLTALLAALTIAASALATGGSMFSPGALNAEPGQVLGGVSSHADIAGNCKSCHAAPWDAGSMDERCVACHVDVAAEMLDPASVHGRMMQIDPQANCRTCHPEHKGAHALLTVLEGWRFPHEVTRFKLNGHQRTVEEEPFLCADCHGEDVTRFDMLTCRNCHIQMDMPFIAQHRATFGENCLDCHDGVDRFGDDFDHNRFAFKLDGKHAAVPCAQCHLMATSRSALQATGQNCFSCHAQDDPHQGKLGPDCTACHSPAGWKPSSFDHNRSQFKLNGAHVRVACEKCHQDSLYKGTSLDCFSCHRQIDPHTGQLGTACETCHTTEAWKPARFDHDTTGFILTGSHVNVACNSCHLNGIYSNTPRDCFACHAANDVHRGQFGRNCAACHQTTKWQRGKFDHHKTAFPLFGQHTTVSCMSCHRHDIFKGTPKTCFSCHARDDKHNGQLGRDCSLCHLPTGWQDITFDHNATAFPLTGKHSLLDCRQCHTAGQFKLPTDCAACHREPAFHTGAFGKNCAQCHTTSDWPSATFSGPHPVALGQNFLDHHEATCKDCHTATVHQFTCVACHETDPFASQGGTPVPTDTPVVTGTPVPKETSPVNEPSVRTSITPAAIQVGDTSQLMVSLNYVPAQGYTSTEFTCTYDPALVEVSDISLGNLFGPDAVSGIFGPQNGSFILAVAGSNGKKASDSGLVFTFLATGLQAGETTVECKARVSAGLNVLEAIGSLPATMSIAAAPPTATYTPASASIIGQVLAGKPATIWLYGPDHSLIATTTASPDGTFQLTVPAGTYTIAASAEGFLSAQGSVTALNGSSISKPAVSLIAGDLDANGVIDQLDALTIRMNYNNATLTAADLNNDGIVNVIDLGILAENYGSAGPLFWP